MQKAQGDIQNATMANSSGDEVVAVIHEDGTVVSRVRDSVISESTTLGAIDDDASTRGIVSPSSPNDSLPRSVGANDSSDVIPSIPTIRISSESDIEKEDAPQDVSANGEAKQNGMPEHDTLEKPVQAAAAATASDSAEQEREPVSPSQEPFSFSNKRLCERWLDNLFMVLYEVRRGLFLNNLWSAVLMCSCRIYVCGLFSEPRSHISKHSMLHTGKLGLNGRYSGI